MTINPSLYSSAKQDWATPIELYNSICRHYRLTPTLDVCASITDTKCGSAYISALDNALIQDWARYAAFGTPHTTVWMNPPYGRDIGKWIAHAAACTAQVLCLLPARTDTAWFHEFVAHKNPKFLRGRVTFDGAPHPAPFPSLTVLLGELHISDCCEHTDKQETETVAYTHPVFVPGFTRQNKAAHGGCVYTEHCNDCGAQRQIAVNQQHLEYGEWTYT